MQTCVIAAAKMRAKMCFSLLERLPEEQKVLKVLPFHGGGSPPQATTRHARSEALPLRR